ncbi:MAG: hypothetical protein JSW10_03145 [Pseudomonadota bacterium]|nr:MAG: hypothetical protein JSW10_03145 [Pseudomonadota bacterium]
MASLVYQRVVQTMAALIGAAGAVLLIFAVQWGYESVLGIDYVFPLFCLLFVLLGAAMMWTAYRAICAYSIESVKLLSALLTIFLLGAPAEYLQPAFEQAMQSENTGFAALLSVIPIFLSFGCYRMMVAALRRLTLNDESITNS